MDVVRVVSTLFFYKIEFLNTMCVVTPSSKREECSVVKFMSYLKTERSKKNFDKLLELIKKENPIPSGKCNELIICRVRKRNFITKNYLNKYMRVFNLEDAPFSYILSIGAEGITHALKNDAKLVTFYNRTSETFPVLEFDLKNDGSFAPQKIELDLPINKYYGEERWLQGIFLFKPMSA